MPVFVVVCLICFGLLCLLGLYMAQGSSGGGTTSTSKAVSTPKPKPETKPVAEVEQK